MTEQPQAEGSEMSTQAYTDDYVADYVAEKRRTYDAVIAAHRQGYHKPYSNQHSDETLWRGYHDGFRGALYDLHEGEPVSKTGRSEYWRAA